LTTGQILISLSQSERRSEQECRKDVDFIRSGIWKNSGEEYIGKQDKFIKIDRNEFIFSALKSLWNRPETPSDIAVVYGACHQAIVEDFLLAEGFKPLSGSDGWLTISKIEQLPLPKVAVMPEAKLFEQPAVEIPIEEGLKKYLVDGEVKIVLKSPDKFTTVYLIGPLDPRVWLDDLEQRTLSDELFIAHVLRGYYKNLLEHNIRQSKHAYYDMEMKSLVILFTPRNLLAVKNALRDRGGFQIIDDIAPFHWNVHNPVLTVSQKIMGL
jgi:hypothetical protein